ncbi:MULTISPECIES: cytochrome P450 [Thermogemmatispora]|uniref:bifunctional cytochrome P450/NADPH--P450 reductase n=1 Tax=Thermogemmatispora TaxID=768669 RepID=UPI0008536F05|nr:MULTISPECIES: cytochrome P450 [Thermogemmatispora]
MSLSSPFATIPQPKPDPLLKNLKELDPDRPVQSLMRLARLYGPIFRLQLPGREMLVVSSQALVDELCDERRFDKKVHAPLEHIRAFAGDGLFTAYTQEPNWAKAHRILMPAFGPAAMREMFEPMLDIAEQMLLRWERFGPQAVIDVPDNMTRLTLDTIALCAFGERLNSFYRQDMHPFVHAMVEALIESGAQARRLPIQNQLMLLTRRRYEEDIRSMHQFADEIIAHRRLDPEAASRHDLLSRMLQGRDPVTGEGLDDENIRYQLVTFLIAGHETTSGLLSFALYELLKNPHVLARARAHVDEVLGDEIPRFEHLAQLTYIDHVLKETLRLWPTAPAIALQPYEDTLLAGTYPLTKGETILVLIPMLHRDPRAWGEDVERFDPDRFEPARYAQVPANAWKPFGNGQRSCIGRPFALQEATLVLAMILQRFDLIEHDPSYQLRIRETLTLKPEGFFIRARRRAGRPCPPAVTRERARSSHLQPQTQTATIPVRQPVPEEALTPLLVLFGSNGGSSEAFARRIATDASVQGYSASVAPLDEYVGRLPTEGAVVIVTSSYEGQPPDQARQFVAWLETLKAGDLQGVRYAVFGCGNRDWLRTYQAIPKRIDSALAAAGATRLKERGEADARGDFFGDFDRWYDTFWSSLAPVFGKQLQPVASRRTYAVEIVPSARPALLRQGDMQRGTVIANRELVNLASPLGRSKREVEIALPEGMSYRAGDYLAVLPTNPEINVERALRRFGLAPDTQIVLHKARPDSQTSLPTGYPIGVRELLANYVELAQPATRKQVAALAAETAQPEERARLETLAQTDRYEQEVLQRRLSVLDLLEQTPSCALSFGAFLEMLPPMHVRLYSISSSPLWRADHCTITFSVLQAPAFSGQGTYLGVASTYLAAAQPGTSVSVAVRPSQEAFHLPSTLDTPLIMVCAGTGIAPFRGFLQERAILASHGQTLAPALLFFGCDHPAVDYLYREELEQWEQAGIVQLRPAFSRCPNGQIRYVQDRLWHDREEIVALFKRNARIYVCGDGQQMAPAVRATFVRIYQDAMHCSPEEAEAWAREIERTRTRYVADVFS